MILRQLALAACGACLMSTPTLAQQAEAAGGPLRFVGGNRDGLTFVVGALPETRPVKPVEVWEWTMYRNDRAGGELSYDASAFRVRIDCRTGTRQVVAAELFKDGEHLLRLVESAAIETPAPESLQYSTFRMACEPGFHLLGGTDPQADHRAARALADRYFAANP